MVNNIEKCNRRTFKNGLIGTKNMERLPSSIKSLVGELIENPAYSGSGCKPYTNEGGALPGEGPFLEFVAKGNKQRAVVDSGSGGIIYATLNHHKTYFEVL